MIGSVTRIFATPKVHLMARKPTSEEQRLFMQALLDPDSPAEDSEDCLRTSGLGEPFPEDLAVAWPVPVRLRVTRSIGPPTFYAKPTADQEFLE